MIFRIRIFLVLLSVLAAGFLFVPAIASADCANPATTKEAIQCGTNDAAGQSGQPKSLDDTIAKFIDVLSAIVGVVAVIMIVVGGFRYITSGGSAEKVSGAKNTLIYAVIGLVIVALAQIIARFVLHTVTKP